MKVKFFSENPDALEKAIQAWLDQEQPSEIIVMSQSYNGAYNIELTIIYRP